MKAAVPAFLPHIPKTRRFERNAAFREWLVRKIINAERAALTTPVFAKMRLAARARQIDDIVSMSSKRSLRRSFHG